MEKSAKGIVELRFDDKDCDVRIISDELMPPTGTKIKMTWEVPEPEVTCCEKGRYLIRRMPWEVHRVVGCPFCGAMLP